MSPARAPRRPPSGVTVFEVFVCMSILTLAAASLLSAQARDFHYMADSLDETAARRAAGARLEALLGRRAAAVPGTRAFDLDPGAGGTLPGARGEEVVAEAGPGLLSVEVRVSWKGAGGAQRRLALTTLLARGGGR